MTNEIEEKVREMVTQYRQKIHGSEYDYHLRTVTLELHNDYIKKADDRAVQAILALMKPMSREGLIKIIKRNNPLVIGCNKSYLVYPEDLSDAILKEWEKGA